MKPPPLWATRLIASQLPVPEREDVLGDLAERFERRGSVYGWRKARRWYWREALLFFWHIGRHRLGASVSRLKGFLKMSSIGNLLSTVVQDVRYGFRVLASKPAFTGVAVLVLALGIGANTAVFTLVNELLLRPRPAEKIPGQLVGLYSKDLVRPDRYRSFSYPNYLDIREDNDVFSHLLAAGIGLVGVTEGDATHRTMAFAVSSNFFETLGARLTIGRAFEADEERPGYPERVAIVSHGYWQRHGADPGVLGEGIIVNGRDYTIVGVTSKGFTGIAALIAPEVYVPLSAYELVVNDLFHEGSPSGLGDRDNHALLLVGRLHPDLTEQQANPRLEALASRMLDAHPSANEDQTLLVQRLRRVGISTSPGTDTEVYAVFGLLQAMAVVVLLIACLNLANMLLARANARRKEVGIRIAMGAGRGRIVRQLLVEGLLLSLAGGVAGMLLAFAATGAIADSMTVAMPIAIEYDGMPDLRVLGATFAFAAVSTLMFALWPAWRLSRTDVVGELKHQVADGGGRRWLTVRHALVVGQVALSLALLTVGGLFVKSAVDAADADPGFEFRDGIVASVDPALAGYDEARGREVYRELLSRVRALPQVRAASFGSIISFGDISESDRIRRLDSDGDTEDATMTAVSTIIGSDYFASLGLPVLRGRDFRQGEEESPEAPPVVIIDEPLARKLFPDDEPLGQQLVFLKRDDTLRGPPAEIVGIVPGLRHSLYDREAVPHVYVPFGTRYRSGMLLHLKTAGGAAAERTTLGLVRSTVRAVDDRVPILWLKTLANYRETSLFLWLARAGAVMFSVFGGLALFLAVVGIYGVKAYLVTLRTREIGIRIALGAAPRDVLWMVLRDSLVLTGFGMVIGLGLAGLVAMAVASMVYQPSPYDPSILAGAVILLGLASLAATYVPAHRATQVQPSTALRVE